MAKENIENAIKTLKLNGYYTDGLLHINEVCNTKVYGGQKIKFDNKDAYYILECAMTSENIVKEIRAQIKHEINQFFLRCSL